MGDISSTTATKIQQISSVHPIMGTTRINSNLGKVDVVCSLYITTLLSHNHIRLFNECNAPCIFIYFGFQHMKEDGEIIQVRIQKVKHQLSFYESSLLYNINIEDKCTFYLLTSSKDVCRQLDRSSLTKRYLHLKRQ